MIAAPSDSTANDADMKSGKSRELLMCESGAWWCGAMVGGFVMEMLS